MGLQCFIRSCLKWPDTRVWKCPFYSTGIHFSWRCLAETTKAALDLSLLGGNLWDTGLRREGVAGNSAQPRSPLLDCLTTAAQHG